MQENNVNICKEIKLEIQVFYGNKNVLKNIQIYMTIIDGIGISSWKNYTHAKEAEIMNQQN